jgi:hypothetical protein
MEMVPRNVAPSFSIIWLLGGGGPSHLDCCMGSAESHGSMLRLQTASPMAGMIKVCLLAFFTLLITVSAFITTIYRAVTHAFSPRRISPPSVNSQRLNVSDDRDSVKLSIKPKIANPAKVSLFQLCVDKVSTSMAERGGDEDEEEKVQLNSDLAVEVFHNLKQSATLEFGSFQAFKQCSIEELDLRFYRSFRNEVLSDSWIFRSFNPFDNHSIANSLTELDVSASSISNFGFQTICSSCKRLEVLVAENCAFIDDAGFKDLCKLGTSLRALRLRGCNQVGGPSLNESLAEMLLLQELDLSFCRGVVNQTVFAISFLYGLENLKLDGCTGISGMVLGCCEVLSSLRICSLEFCSQISWESISHLPVCACHKL